MVKANYFESVVQRESFSKIQRVATEYYRAQMMQVAIVS